MEEILGVNIHHVLIYPGLSVQSPLQQLPRGASARRRPYAHRDLAFPAQGAPEAIYRRSLAYYNLVNSPVHPGQRRRPRELLESAIQGLSSEGGDWVSFARHFGRDLQKGEMVENRGELRHLGGADAQPDEGLGALHGGAVMELQHEVEQFLYRQSELLDTKQWQAWIDLFDRRTGSTGCRRTRRTEHWDGVPSIFAEDKNLMAVRMKRVLHPTPGRSARSGATNHVVSNVILEKTSPDEVIGPLALPHDGAAARRRAPLRRSLPPSPREDRRGLSHQAAARGHDQRAGGPTSTCSRCGSSPGRILPLAPAPVAAPVVAGAAGLRPFAARDHPGFRRRRWSRRSSTPTSARASAARSPAS
jgi:hypothetical protein